MDRDGGSYAALRMSDWRRAEACWRRMIIIYNGNTYVDFSRKQRRRLQNDMDTNNFHRSFMFKSL